MLYNIEMYFILFILYSFIGYCTEVICVSLVEKRINFSRGFLIGPIIPIYGIGMLLEIILLTKYQNDYLILFIMGVFICTVIEYLASYLMEKIFGLRWWDYSTKKFNLNGRVCLDNCLLFGIGSCLFVGFINPQVINYLSTIPSNNVLIIFLVVLCIFILDLAISTYVTINLKINANKYLNKDATSEIKREVRASLNKTMLLNNRLLQSFPDILKLNGKKYFDFNNLLIKIKNEKERIVNKEAIKEIKAKIKAEKLRIREIKHAKKKN